jgi:primase-polymerase (primpol)-like protein
MQDDHYVGVILEEIRDQYKVLNERFDDLNHLPAKVDNIEAVVERIDADNKAMKLAIKDQTRQLDNHEGRITHLETA